MSCPFVSQNLALCIALSNLIGGRQDYCDCGVRKFLPDISPGLFPHTSNLYLGTQLFPSIQFPFEQKTCFIEYKLRLDQFWANFVIFYIFTTQQRFLLPVQLSVNNDLFHKSSFDLKIEF